LKWIQWQNRHDEAIGELWNCKEELRSVPIKRSVEQLIHILDYYKPIDVLEILRILYDLQFRVDSNNFVYDENLEFDLSDVKKSY